MNSPCVAQCFEVAKTMYHGKGKSPMQNVEDIRPVPEERNEGGNRLSVMLIRASPDTLKGRVSEKWKGC
eukprot:12791185-Prorocentrum_lima.AAC.1